MKRMEAASIARLDRAASSAAFSEFVLTLMRAQDALTRRAEKVLPAGMTVARWQIMKALGLLGGAATVPAIARSLLLSRQAVLKQVDSMRQHQLVELCENPAHSRSPIVRLTRSGHAAYAAASARWLWISMSLEGSVDPAELEQTRQVLDRLVAKLDQDEPSSDEAPPKREG
jgi:DNA-binding MarR family transcriptional regulator